MNKKTSLLIGIFLLIIAVCFISYAVNHPEATFPWNNRVTFMFYGIYIWLIFKFLLAIPVLKAIKKNTFNWKYIKSRSFFFSWQSSFLLWSWRGKQWTFTPFLEGLLLLEELI